MVWSDVNFSSPAHNITIACSASEARTQSTTTETVMTVRELSFKRKDIIRRMEVLRKELKSVDDKVYDYNILPSNLRKAEPKDIVLDNVIWYKKDEYSDNYCKIVDEVLHPDSMYKSFCATDGCRYGLDGAFVEVI